MGAIYSRAILGGRNKASREKDKRKVDIACDKKWLPPYSPSPPGKDTMGESNGKKMGHHPCQQEMNIPASGWNCKVRALIQRNVEWNLLGILTLRHIELMFMGPQIFPVNVAPDPNLPLAFYPWKDKDLKN